MSIYKTNKQNLDSNRINQVNDMVIEVNGKVDQGKFNKNVLTTMYTTLPLSAKYLRDQTIGGTTGTYAGWTHLKAEAGYSIWKFSPTNYTYNSVNELYFDNAVLTNKGEADSESATAFDKVLFYDGSTYTDNTAEAATEEGTEFSVMDAAAEYLYVGDAATFSGAKFEFQTRGSNYTLVVEYWSGAAWTTMTANTNVLDDDTSDFESNGRITWTAPGDWATTTVDSNTLYWIRFSTTSVPVTTAKVYYLIPGDSVIGLLAMSSSEIQNEEWMWCSYTTAIYVTIRNDGNSSYEGDYYITSSSSTANLQNFFIYNHTYTSNYETSAYSPLTTKTNDYTATTAEGVFLLDGTSNTVTLLLPAIATANKGTMYIIKAIDISSTVKIDCTGADTIDGAAEYTFSSQYETVTLQSDGTSSWWIIGKV